MIDDRISCFDCRDFGRCSGPARAEPELPRRCELFEPKRQATDQRRGRERFQTLWAERQDLAQHGIRHAKRAIGATDRA